MNLVSLACLILIAPGDRPDLKGVVVTGSGAPVLGAHVVIETAAVRQGSSPTCPSCYLDCGKRTETAEDGSFTLPAVDPSLQFRLLVIADGFRPTFARRVDPLREPVQIPLAPLDLAAIPPERIVRGQVVGPEGKPVAGATVEAHSYRTEARSGSGPGVFEPLAITDLGGNFALVANSPIRDVTLEVSARNLAPALFTGQKPAPASNRLALGVGVEVKGRLIRDQQPVGGVSVGLVQVDRGSQNLLVPMTIGTDAEGRFVFSNVAPDRDCFVYGIMDSLKELGGAPARRVKVSGDGTQLNVGDLTVEPGHRVAGQVVLGDGQPVPAGTRLQVSRAGAWDHVTTVLDAEGRFAFVNLPGEQVSLSVQVPGYHLSSRNKSIDPQGSSRLIGFIDEDLTGLKILLEPGP